MLLLLLLLPSIGRLRLRLQERRGIAGLGRWIAMDEAAAKRLGLVRGRIG